MKTSCMWGVQEKWSVAKAEIELRTCNRPTELNTRSIETDGILHQRFCHVNSDTIWKLAKSNQMVNTKINSPMTHIVSLRKVTKVTCKKLKQGSVN